MNAINEVLDHNGQHCSENDLICTVTRSVLEVCAERAEAALRSGQLEDTLIWASVAGAISFRFVGCEELVLQRLESLLLTIAERIEPEPERLIRPRTRLLHVLSEAYGIYGHTKLCRMWIEMDQQHRHDVVILRQKQPMPENLRNSVTKCGGQLVQFDPSWSLLERARKLRRLAYSSADVVVLHVHPDDVIPVVAFGIPGGPPVMVMNHADHIFWYGAGIADLVAEIRESGCHWTRQHRGITRSGVLHIPLGNVPNSGLGDPPRLAIKREARQRLGLPEDGVMVLSAGAPYKYNSLKNYDFCSTIIRFLRQCRQAYMVVIGPGEANEWRQAERTLPGRLFARGPQYPILPYYQAADIYAEGFPLGALTTVLEAGLEALPMVRTPQRTPAPFGFDSSAFSLCPRPKDADEYVEQLSQLVSNEKARETLGANLREAIIALYCNDGWLVGLNQVLESLTDEHRIYSLANPLPVPREVRDFWIEFKRGGNPLWQGVNPIATLCEVLPEQPSTFRPSFVRPAMVLSQEMQTQFRDRRRLLNEWVRDCLRHELAFYTQRGDREAVRRALLEFGIGSLVLLKQRSSAKLIIRALLGETLWKALKGFKRTFGQLINPDLN